MTHPTPKLTVVQMAAIETILHEQVETISEAIADEIGLYVPLALICHSLLTYHEGDANVIASNMDDSQLHGMIDNLKTIQQGPIQ